MADCYLRYPRLRSDAPPPTAILAAAFARNFAIAASCSGVSSGKMLKSEVAPSTRPSFAAVIFQQEMLFNRAQQSPKTGRAPQLLPLRRRAGTAGSSSMR